MEDIENKDWMKIYYQWNEGQLEILVVGEQDGKTMKAVKVISKEKLNRMMTEDPS